jgi:hypothetical protein
MTCQLVTKADMQQQHLPAQLLDLYNMLLLLLCAAPATA